jgi:predicted DNA-binding transcriptional regulator YafY
MAETTSRILSLLNLLQTHRQWAGPDLAARLGVTERTLRRDIERLRDLGYRVDATRGAAGGYRLEAGSQLPPLLLTDDEAVAMAIGLRVTASQGLVDGEHTGLAALAKFEQVLPPALRARVAALAAVVEAASPGSTPVASDLLGRLALACRDRERIRFSYVSGDGSESSRVVEPHSLVAARRRWFLVCWDRDRDDWRTFRVDRITEIFATRVHFTERALPAADAAVFVETAITGLREHHQGDVVMAISLAQLRQRFGTYASAAVALDDTHVAWPISGESFESMLGSLSWVPADIDYEIVASREFLDFTRSTAERMLRAATSALDSTVTP